MLERLEALDPGSPNAFNTAQEVGPCTRQRRDLLGDLADLHVEADRGVEQPVELPFGGADAVLVRAQAEYRAVVDEMPASLHHTQ